MTDTSLFVLVGGVAVLIVGVAAAGWFLVVRRLRERQRLLAGEIADARELAQDRAFNQIRIANEEVRILERDGVDVSRPRSLLEEAEAASRRHDFHHALQLARNSHDSLVLLRRGPAPSPGTPPPYGLAAGDPGGPAAAAALFPDLSQGAAGMPLGTTDPAASGELARPAIPKNRLESRFQMGLLTEELQRAVAGRPGDAGVAEANILASQARAAEGREDYTEALRLALRARRVLGARVEALPPTVGAAPAPRSEAAPGPASPPPPKGPNGGSEDVCAQCGRPRKASDAFCRSCGASRGPVPCPRCGQALEPTDRFCGRCGSPVG